MRGFIVRLVVFCCFILSLIVCTVVGETILTRSQMHPVYDISIGVKTLFLGSSQMGCSIVEQPEYENYVLWSSEKTIYSSLARLRELEKRGQLGKIKNCVVYWNLMTLQQQRVEDVNRSWWSEFPVTWNRCADFPSSGWSKLTWAMEHLQWPMDFSVKSLVPDRQYVVAEQSEAWKKNFYDSLTNQVVRFKVADLAPGWREATKHCYLEMARICRAHGIRFIVVGFPMLNAISPFYSAEHHDAVRQIASFLRENGIEYVPYEGSCDETVFFDDVHMIRRTAEDYTSRLYKLLAL